MYRVLSTFGYEFQVFQNLSTFVNVCQRMIFMDVSDIM